MNIMVGQEGENGVQVTETRKHMSLAGSAQGMRRKPEMEASLHLHFLVEKLKGLHQRLKD